MIAVTIGPALRAAGGAGDGRCRDDLDIAEVWPAAG
jgi:hypothetical protein